jgi:hypothetical protein
MRTDINIRLVCSICDKLLESDSINNKSRIEYSSADNTTAVIAIVPCRTCYEKAKLPAQLISQALKEIKDNG